MVPIDTVERLVAAVGGDAGVVVRELNGGKEIVVNGGIQFKAASIIKLPILWSFFRACQDGRLDPDESVTITPDCLAGGFGVLRTLKPGVPMRLRDLAALMIVVSDNTATNILIDRLGIDGIQADIEQLGLTATRLQRRMCDYDNPKDNLASPLDVANILATFADAPFADELMAILTGQQCRNKLRASIPDDLALAHKTGDLPGIEHDAGILFAADRRLIIVVMTQGLKSNEEGENLCRRIGELVSQSL